MTGPLLSLFLFTCLCLGSGHCWWNVVGFVVGGSEGSENGGDGEFG